MSEFVETEVEIDDPADAVEALKMIGEQFGLPWNDDTIEVHATPQELLAIGGAKRTSRRTGERIRAEIIIRRKHVGNSSNDLGILKGADGKYTIYESDFDVGQLRSKMGTPFKKAFKKAVAFQKIKKESKKQRWKLPANLQVDLRAETNQFQVTRWM